MQCLIIILSEPFIFVPPHRPFFRLNLDMSPNIMPLMFILIVFSLNWPSGFFSFVLQFLIWVLMTYMVYGGSMIQITVSRHSPFGSNMRGRMFFYQSWCHLIYLLVNLRWCSLSFPYLPNMPSLSHSDAHTGKMWFI